MTPNQIYSGLCHAKQRFVWHHKLCREDKLCRKFGSGFTLIELITAVVIIAILVSIAVPTYNKAVENAREREARTNLELIYNAQKLYRIDKGAYAGTFALLASYIEDPNVKAQYYTFAIAAASASAFEAIATRKNDATKSFIINEAGSIYEPDKPF